MRVIIGVFSIILVVLSLAPNIVPGAMSIIGLGLTLFALVLSVFSVQKGKYLYFNVTLALAVFAILVANDTTRVYWAMPGVSAGFKVGVYLFSLAVIVGCIYFLKKQLRRERT